MGSSRVGVGWVMFGVKIHLVDIIKLSLNPDTGNQVVIRPSFNSEVFSVCQNGFGYGFGSGFGLGFLGLGSGCSFGWVGFGVFS